MDKEALQRHLRRLASGKERANTPLVEAYLADEQAGKVARLLEQTSRRYHLSKIPLLSPPTAYLC